MTKVEINAVKKRENKSTLSAVNCDYTEKSRIFFAYLLFYFGDQRVFRSLEFKWNNNIKNKMLHILVAMVRDRVKYNPDNVYRTSNKVILAPQVLNI